MGSRLQLESNVLELIPEGNPPVDAFKAALTDFGSIDYLILLLEPGPRGSVEDLQELADRVGPALRERTAWVETVDYRFEPDAALLRLIFERALLFVEPGELDAVAERLTDEAIREQVARNRLELASPAGTVGWSRELLVQDPLGLTPLLLDRVGRAGGALQIDLADGYYLAADRRALIMLVKPTGASMDLEFDEGLLAQVRAVLEEAQGALSDVDPTWNDERVRVRLGGNYAIAVDEAALIRQDISFNIVFSLSAVLLLYWVCYRRLAALFYSGLPLLVGQALTFALALVVLRELNASSSAFTALLMGLGTDFVIVVYARYIEERRRGADLATATERMIGETGLGVFTGAITSAGTFYAACVSQFRGLRDLGFLIGSGILLCAVAILFLLPAMIQWNEGVRRRRRDAVEKLHLQSFLLERLIPWSAHHRVTVIVLTLGLSALSAWAALGLEFEDTVNVLRSNRSPALNVQEEVRERFGAALSYMMVISHGATLDQAVARSERAAERLQPFVEDGTVRSVDTLSNYLPPREQQAQVIAALRNDPDGRFDPERIRSTFLAALQESGFRAASFAPFLDRLDQLLRPPRPLTLDDLERDGLGPLLRRYVRRAGPPVANPAAAPPEAARDGSARVVSYLFLGDPRWKRDPPPGLIESVGGDDPAVVVTGTNVVGREFRRIFSREAPRAVGLGLLVVFVLLWVDFRSLRLTAVALSQLVCGVLLMLGLMRVSGIALNFVNAFVATMILGVGIDYSIHLVHRFSLSRGRLEPGLLETGKAVVLAALTNVAGFGTLILGNYPALRSFGTVALFGSLTCLLTALTWVPALMARRD